MLKKIHIFITGFAGICAGLIVLLFTDGLNNIELVGIACCAGGAVWLLRYFYTESKTLIGRLDILERDYKLQREKIMQAVMEAKDYKLQAQLLKRQKHNTEAIIYSINDAVIVTDINDRLLLANAQAGEILGFDANNSVLKLLEDLVSDSDIVNLIKKSRQGKIRDVRHELEFETKEGPRIYECIISCIFDENAQICGAVSVLHDITREREISQMKNEFVSHVSHELKTPLASITAYAEMLVDGEASDEKTRKEFYSIIQTQAQRLNRLIEDILNVSRIESGLVKLNKEPISAMLLVRDAVQMIKSYAAEKQIEVEEKTAIVFDQVLGDKDMISQVIINLLSNAVKYTPENGRITVDGEVDESEQVVRIKVTDTGVGIPAEEIEHLFNKFYRVKANNKYAKGTGLGLNLVKQIIEKLHGGRVFVTSSVGKGSCFGFELPLMAQKVTV
ncbi:MAG: Alkaline phosphatase synthesis sensor protein PhoR [Planctomycetes bacterium ADurb.Bin401]|nr:MAG: Alkaline phosphatase synthesis sensor protein PhoR [Planctomycetes bacterium ADurb.Bin401]